MIAGWGESGSVDLLEFFAELTIYTSSAALVGPEFREELGPELVPLFADLERGTDPLAYVHANLPIASFRARDRARKQLAAYKAPRHLVIVDELRRSPSGKPDYPWATELAKSALTADA